MFARVTRWSALFAGVLVASILSGCGGGGGGSATTGGGTDGGGSGGNQLDAALNDLNALIRQTSPSTADLTALRNRFSTLASANPTNVAAQTGLALTSSAVAARRLTDLWADFYPEADLLGLPSPLVNSALRLRLSQTTNGNLAPINAPVPDDLVVGVLPFLGLTGRYSVDDPAPWEVVEVLDAAISDAEVARAALASLGTDPNGLAIYDVTPDIGEDPESATALFAVAERQALRSHLELFQSLATILVAYEFDLGSFDPNRRAKQVYNSAFQDESPLAPADYLPGNPFLTLTTGGASQLSAAGELWRSSALEGLAALATYRNRSGGDYVIASGTLSPGLVQSAEESYARFRDLGEGPVEVPDLQLGNEIVTINLDLSVLFTNPPADLKAFFPTLAPSAPDEFDTFLGINPDIVPDLTWGGIFPDGLPATVLVDRSELVDDGWDVGDVLIWAWNLF